MDIGQTFLIHKFNYDGWLRVRVRLSQGEMRRRLTQCLWLNYIVNLVQELDFDIQNSSLSSLVFHSYHVCYLFNLVCVCVFMLNYCLNYQQLPCPHPLSPKLKSKIESRPFVLHAGTHKRHEESSIHFLFCINSKF